GLGGLIDVDTKVGSVGGSDARQLAEAIVVEPHHDRRDGRGHAESPAPLDTGSHCSPVAGATERVMLPLGRKVEGKLYAVESLDRAVGQPIEAQAVGRDARPDTPVPDGVEDAPILRMKPVLSDAEIERTDRKTVTDPTNVLECQSIDDGIRTIAVSTP